VKAIKSKIMNNINNTIKTPKYQLLSANNVLIRLAQLFISLFFWLK